MKQWREQYDFPKLPLNISVGRLNYAKENFPEGKRQENESPTQHIVRLNALIGQKQEFFKQHDNILRQKLENENQGRVVALQKYKEEYEYPPNITQLGLYMRKNNLALKNALGPYKAISAEEKQALEQEHKQFLEEREKRMKKLAEKYNMTPEELSKEVKRQRKISKKNDNKE